jgi:DNA processing protein
LALGIVAASHRGALAGGGVTIAVCGTGLDRVYPIEHGELAERIRGNGALVSEFPPGTPPLKGNFPQRNRVISGLSMGTLVVEAAVQSGSHSTARHARKQGRNVFAVPGSIASPLSAGCHQLIREGASLVWRPEDVLLELEIPLPNEGLVRRRGGPGQRRAMDKGYEMLLDAVGFGPVSVDVLAVRTGLPVELITSMLLVLELEGRIAPYPGGQFGRIP